MAEEFDPKARFKRLRKEAKQDVTARSQQAQEALQRRFAAQGLLSSGAAIKAQQQTEGQAQNVLQRRLGQIQSAEEQEAQRQSEIKQAREFARSEREASQAFGAEQAALQREFARGERISGQEFGSKQADIARKFARGERLSSQEFAAAENELNRALQEKVQEIQQSQFGQQMDLAMQQFELDKATTAFNKAQAEREANKKNIFERAGDFGTGVWKAATSGFSGASFDVAF